MGFWDFFWPFKKKSAEDKKDVVTEELKKGEKQKEGEKKNIGKKVTKKEAIPNENDGKSPSTTGSKKAATSKDQDSSGTDSPLQSSPSSEKEERDTTKRVAKRDTSRQDPTFSTVAAESGKKKTDEQYISQSPDLTETPLLPIQEEERCQVKEEKIPSENKIFSTGTTDSQQEETVESDDSYSSNVAVNVSSTPKEKEKNEAINQVSDIADNDKEKSTPSQNKSCSVETTEVENEVTAKEESESTATIPATTSSATEKEEEKVVTKEKKPLSFWSRLKRMFVGPRKLTAEELEDVEEILIEADLGMKMTEEIMETLQGKVNEDFSFAEIVEVLKEEISNRLAAVHSKEVTGLGKPHVMLVVGVNGVGKTTTIGKLAHYYVKQGKKVVLGAADTFRAAAPEQLTTWAERSGSSIVSLGMQKDPSGVAYETIQQAAKENADVAIIDTAGRLQNKVPLMNQLGKIKRVIQKLSAEAPHEVLLVLDATTGQNGWQQAAVFKEAVGVTGLIVTKLDSLAKGGIIIGITAELGIPVKYLGFGEKLDDLRTFDVKEFVDRFFERKE